MAVQGAGRGQRYPLIIVGARGVARVASSSERATLDTARSERQLAARLGAVAVPVACGPEVLASAARGPMVQFAPREAVRGIGGGTVVRKSGYMGRDGARVADAFDLMTLQAKRAHPRVVAAARRAHPDRVEVLRQRHDQVQADRVARGAAYREFVAPEFVAPAFGALFAVDQVQVGRDYAALSERVAGSGVKCSSLESVGGGGSGGREEAVLRDIARLRGMHRRIGSGLAKEVRRIRPSGAKRRPIYARALVDMVCIGGLCLGDVLRAHGWANCKKGNDALLVALCAALGRMSGYGLASAK